MLVDFYAERFNDLVEQDPNILPNTTLNVLYGKLRMDLLSMLKSMGKDEFELDFVPRHEFLFGKTLEEAKDNGIPEVKGLVFNFVDFLCSIQNV